MKRWILAIIAGALAATGCAAEIEKPALEDIGLIGVMGFDMLPPKRMKVIVSLPQPSKTATERTQVYKTIGDLPVDALMKLSTKSEKTMSLTQLRVVLFSEEFARKMGLRKVVENLYRNPSVGDNVYIGVVKGSVEELLMARYENKPELNTFLNDLLHPRKETSFHSFMTIHDMMFRLTDQVSDPDLPYLEKRQGDIQITKVALFHADKMIGFLTQGEGKLVQAIRSRTNLPDMDFLIPDKNNPARKSETVLNFIRSTSKIRVSDRHDAPHFRIRLSSSNRIIAYSGTRNLESPNDMGEVREMVENEMSRQAVNLLKKLQTMRVEPCGLLEKLRARHRGMWSKEIGMKAFQKATFEVQTRMVIIGIGIIR